jgi:hypothetical protein
VTVTEAPVRVVVQDVRTGGREMVDDLGAVGGRLAELLEAALDGEDGDGARGQEDGR